MLSCQKQNKKRTWYTICCIRLPCESWTVIIWGSCCTCWTGLGWICCAFNSVLKFTICWLSQDLHLSLTPLHARPCMYVKVFLWKSFVWRKSVNLKDAYPSSYLYFGRIIRYSGQWYQASVVFGLRWAGLDVDWLWCCRRDHTLRSCTLRATKLVSRPGQNRLLGPIIKLTRGAKSNLSSIISN